MVSWIFIMSSSHRRIGVAFSLAHYHWEGKEKKDATPARRLECYFLLQFLWRDGFWGIFSLRILAVEKFPLGWKGKELTCGFL